MCNPECNMTCVAQRGAGDACFSSSSPNMFPGRQEGKLSPPYRFLVGSLVSIQHALVAMVLMSLPSLVFPTLQARKSTIALNAKAPSTKGPSAIMFVPLSGLLAVAVIIRTTNFPQHQSSRPFANLSQTKLIHSCPGSHTRLSTACIPGNGACGPFS